MSTLTTPVVYPVHVDAELDPQLSRGLWLVKWLLVIPHYVVLVFLWLAFAVTSIVAFFAILITARYPRALFDFNVGVMRWSWRVAYYAYGALGTDRYPPFTLAEVPDYPAHLEVDYPEHLSRGLVLVKWWLLAIPHYLVVGLFMSGIGYGASDPEEGWLVNVSLIGLLVLVAAVTLLFSGRYPRPIFDLVLGLNRWVLRVAGYVALMTDRYPPFSLDQGGHELPTGEHRSVSTEPPPVPIAGAAADTRSQTAYGIPPSTPEPRRTGWTGGRVLSLLLGSLLVAIGLGLGVGGGFLAAADQTARDADGFLVSPQEGLVSDGFAIVSEDARVHSDGVLGALPDDVIGDVRLSAEQAGDTDLFIGIAPTVDVRAYLAGVQHDVLLDLPSSGPVYRSADGGQPSTAPDEQTFWVAEASGAQPELTWALEDGDWTAVVMNADGSGQVAAEVSVGAEVPILDTVIATLLIAAGIALVLGGVLIAVPVRSVSDESRHATP
ncbi:DUF4389 domain-containing protein [Nocardioides pacificus]